MSDIGEGPVDFRRVDITAFVKRLVRYHGTQGNGDWRYAAEIIEQQHGEIERLRARVAELEAEAFGLAANQCHRGYATENGDHRCKYQDRIAELEAAQKWRPIESAPKNGGAVLVSWIDWKGDRCINLGWPGEDGWLPYDRNLTHWLPLPAPPKVAT